MSLREGERKSMARAALIGSEIRGEIVELLLPKWKERSGKDCLYLQTQPALVIIKAETVYLQVGDNNSIRVGVDDIAMPDDVSDCLTKASEDDELVVRVLRRHGGSEELVLIKDARRIRQSIDIRADYFRIIPPLDEKPNLDAVFTVVSEINARHALIGGNNKIVMNPDGFLDVFDSIRPVLRVLRSFTKPTSVFRAARDFPNFEKDHLVVLEVCKNRCTSRALEYSFVQSSSLAGSKDKDYYDVKVTVSENGRKNEKTEIREEVLFNRDPSFDSLHGVVGLWFRFQSAQNRYIVTFSLWKKRTETQPSELLDEIHIDVETCERKSLSKRNRRQRSERCSSKSLPGQINGKPTSLTEQRHIAVETRERKFPPRKIRKQRCSPNPVSEETSLPDQSSTRQTSLPGQSPMTVETSKPSPRKKRYQRHLPNPGSEETSLPGSIHSKQTSLPDQSVVDDKSLPAEVTGFYEQMLDIMMILRDFRDDGEWEKFNREAEQLLKKYARQTDLQIAIILEQGMAACYRKELKSAEDFIKEAIAKVPQASENLVSLWKGRASYYLAGIYRRDKMALGKAEKYIASAKKHLKNTAFVLDRGCLAYEEGSLLLEQAHMTSMAEESKRCFDRCIEICSIDIKESANNLLLKTHDMALMKKVMLLMDCCTKSGRESRSVKEETIIEAKQCLNSLKMNFAPEMPRTLQVQHHLVRSDQYFREQRLVDACAHARIAFDLSHRYHFDTTEAAEVRLNFVNKLRNSN